MNIDDRERKVNLEKLSEQSVDQISSELNKKVQKFMKETQKQREQIEQKLQEVNSLLKIYGLNLIVGYEMKKLTKGD